MNAIMIDRIILNFSSWDLENYKKFLLTKLLPEYELQYDFKNDSYQLTTPARFAPILGEKYDRKEINIPVANFLFDYEKYLVTEAIRARRYAIWADTGLGKTAIGLECARQISIRTIKRVLIIAPLNIIQQWRDQAFEFYGPEYEIDYPETSKDLLEWLTGPGNRIGITNTEKMLHCGQENISEVKYLGGVILDESSCLKSGGGKIKWMLIHSCKGLEYKISLTATPAPNDTMEYASQGSFLEKLRHEGEIIWTYFKRDKQGNWKVKEHAKKAFYQFMSGWSIYLQHPVRYGFADNLKDLPKPEYIIKKIDITREQELEMNRILKGDDQLLTLKDENTPLGMLNRIKLSQVAKGFIYGKAQKVERYIRSFKPEYIALMASKDIAEGRQVIIWTLFDAESEILHGLLKNYESMKVLTGKTPQDKRQRIIEDFRTGKISLLITRASVLGHGLNFQMCTSMIFSGFDDSFERFYQAVRRAYRYGQKKQVRIYIPYIEDLEGRIWDNIQKKATAFDGDTAIMEKHYREAMESRRIYE